MPSLGREAVDLALAACREEVPPEVLLDVVRAVVLVVPRRKVAVEISRDGLSGVAGDAVRVGEQLLGLERDSIEENVS